MQTVNWAGSSYNIPNQRGDTPWSGLSDFAIAVAAKGINTNGGAFTLLADINFGATFGIVSTYFKSRTAIPATAGVIRLSNLDLIEWRNFANGGNLALAVNSSDRLTFNSVLLATAAAALTASRALVSDGSGNITVATTTATEIGYVNGVTSAIQTQLNTKAPSASPTFTGTVTLPVTADRALQTGTASVLEASATTKTELGYVSGVTSAIQTQLNTKATGTIAAQNILVNGGMEVWQRASTFSSPADGAYTADRWQVSKGSTPTFTVVQETSNIGAVGLRSLKLAITNAGASTSLYLRQQVDNFTDFRGRTLTISASVKSDSNKFRLEAFDGVTESFSAAHSGGNTFETLTLTITVAAGATSGQFGFGFTGASFGPVVSTSYVDMIMVANGSATPVFYADDPEILLARCQRFYEKSYAVDATPATATGTNINRWTGVIIGVNQVLTANLQFKVQKRTTPTMVIYNAAGTSGSADWTNSTGTTTSRVTAANTTGTNGFAMFQSVTSADLLADAHFTADAEIA